jgi:hypothetical protein
VTKSLFPASGDTSATRNYDIAAALSAVDERVSDLARCKKSFQATSASIRTHDRTSDFELGSSGCFFVCTHIGQRSSEK